MTRGRRARSVWVLVVASLLGLAALATSSVDRRQPTPHEVPVVVQGPSVVAEGIAGRLNRLPGRPLVAVVAGRGESARQAVADGDAAGALVLQLEAGQDALLVSAVNDPEMNTLLRRLAERVGSPLDRTFGTTEVPPRANPDLPRSSITWSTAGWVVAGFVMALAWSLLRRRRVPLSVGPGRVLLLIAGSAGLALAATAPVALVHEAPFLSWWLVSFLVICAVALAAAALEDLGGLGGVLVAGAFLLLLSGPLFSGRDPHLLPKVWFEVDPWTMHGAARELTSSLFWFDRVRAQPLVLLISVLVVSGVVLLVRSLPRRDAQAPADPTEGPTEGPTDRRPSMVVLVALVPAVLAALGATVLAPRIATDVAATPPTKAVETSCLPVPDITSIKDLNTFVGTVRSGPAFQGADVGADVRLQDGRHLWVFGDTLRSPDFEGQQFVRNSMLVFEDRCAHTVVPADRGALIPDRGDGTGYWPMSIARIERKDYDLVGVAAQRVRTTSSPDGAEAFENLGSAMSVFVVQRGKTPQLVGLEDIGPDDKDPGRPEWGAAATVHDGWVYLYGTSRPAEPGIFGFSLHVARFRPDDLLNRRAWRYWDGDEWQGSASRAAALIPADRGVSQTLSVFPRRGRWYAVSKRDEFLGTDLVVWTARSPTGPFDSGTTVAKIPSNQRKGELRYMPLAHPDLFPGKPWVVVSYSRNNTDTEKVVSDPFLYRPKFLKVRLPEG